jgi:hypothetical protein
MPEFLVNGDGLVRKRHREMGRLIDFLIFHTHIPNEFDKGAVQLVSLQN